MDIVAYALSKKYTEDTSIGLGALKGAPCTIVAINEIDNTNAIILAATSSGIVASRTYADGTLGAWTSPNNEYSTTETVVGTWIDGKPIYRKSYSFEINDTFISKTLETVAIDNIIKVYGSYGGGSSLMRLVPYDSRTSQVDYSGANTSSSTEYSEVFYQVSDTTLRFYCKITKLNGKSCCDC